MITSGAEASASPEADPKAQFCELEDELRAHSSEPDTWEQKPALHPLLLEAIERQKDRLKIASSDGPAEVETDLSDEVERRIQKIGRGWVYYCFGPAPARTKPVEGPDGQKLLISSDILKAQEQEYAERQRKYIEVLRFGVAWRASQELVREAAREREAMRVRQMLVDAVPSALSAQELTEAESERDRCVFTLVQAIRMVQGRGERVNMTSVGGEIPVVRSTVSRWHRKHWPGEPFPARDVLSAVAAAKKQDQIGTDR